MDIVNLKELIGKKLQEINLRLYDIKIVTFAKEKIIQVSITKKGIISIDDCINASNHLQPYLEEMNVLGDMVLEVSSPGAERLLRNKLEMDEAIGQMVLIKTYEGEESGKLLQVDDDFVLIKTKRNKEIKIAFVDINLIRLALNI